ncbi:MAG: GNAT family N-acetyltransferase [Bacteroides sp.]|nr:GNAT family N-acetyltransferase [Ruminococcus flavefaciens]MCM1555594.1 GNAT family N-acetyltransferase [Bacteroides sp.]
MHLRPYDSDDLEEILQLFYETVHRVNIRDYSEEQVNAWASGRVNREDWDASLRNHISMVAVDNGKIVGFGDMDSSGYLDRLYVHYAHQRKGIATVICNRLESLAKADCITVHASITARPFFEKRGYKTLAVNTVKRNGVPLTNYLMQLQR